MRTRCETLMSGRAGLCLLVFAPVMLAGCAVAPPDVDLRERAAVCLQRGMRYPENPAVRAQSIEAAAEVLGYPSAVVFREALADEHPGVRFAACMALGRLADRNSADLIRKLTADPDPSVRIGAFYAMERLGDPSHRRAWAQIMRDHPSSEVRRNAVMALGLLEDANARSMLKRVASEDADDGVRLQAVEGLALLGDSDAEAGFVRDAFGGIGYRQPFALLALGHVRSRDSVAALKNRLHNAPYLEARLAAARGLGMHGQLDGFDLALRSLTWNDPDLGMPEDPPENQIMRVRSMAAMALGDMLDRRALGPLSECMQGADDPRVQVAAARSILLILGSQPENLDAKDGSSL